MTEHTGTARPSSPAAEPVGTRRRRELAKLRDYAVLLALLAVFVGLSLTADPFLTSRNLLNVLEQAAALGIIAVAGTLVLVAGGFDLSVGSLYALSGVVAAQLADSTGSFLAIVLALLIATTLGVGNGLLVAGVGINPFIATLASAIVLRGVALALTGGFLVNVTDPAFRTFGAGTILGVRHSVWVWVAVTLGMGFLLARTRFGRYVYATGGNPEATRLSGIRVPLVRTATFALSGFAAGLAGVLAASRVGTGQADAGVGLELTAVAAIVVGGTSIRGGEGSIWRTIVGVLLLSLIGNGFNLLGLDPVFQNVVFGSVILVAAGVDARMRRTTN